MISGRAQSDGFIVLPHQESDIMIGGDFMCKVGLHYFVDGKIVNEVSFQFLCWGILHLVFSRIRRSHVDEEAYVSLFLRSFLELIVATDASRGEGWTAGWFIGVTGTPIIFVPAGRRIRHRGYFAPDRFPIDLGLGLYATTKGLLRTCHIV